MDPEVQVPEETIMEVDEQQESTDITEGSVSSCGNAVPDSGFFESAEENKQNEDERGVQRKNIVDDDGDVENEIIKPKNKSRIKIIYPDSESDDEDVERGEEESKEKGDCVRKSGMKLFDSDDDDENNSKPEEENNSKLEEENNGKSEEENNSKPDEQKLSANNKEGDTNDGLKNGITNEDRVKQKLSMLCDSESSDEEETSVAVEEDKAPDFKVNEDNLKSDSSKGKKKKRNTKVDDGNELDTQVKKMTAIEAMKQRKEIQSESQRMTRESEVRLPYHKPKQRSLKEFLAKRTKFSETINIPIEKKSASVSIKIANQHLDILSKRLEECERETEEFFKSDSEPEEEEDDSDKDYVPGNEVDDETDDTQLEINKTNCDSDVLKCDVAKTEENLDENIQETVDSIVGRLNEDEEEDFDLNLGDRNKNTGDSEGNGNNCDKSNNLNEYVTELNDSKKDNSNIQKKQPVDSNEDNLNIQKEQHVDSSKDDSGVNSDKCKECLDSSNGNPSLGDFNKDLSSKSDFIEESDSSKNFGKPEEMINSKERQNTLADFNDSSNVFSKTKLISEDSHNNQDAGESNKLQDEASVDCKSNFEEDPETIKERKLRERRKHLLEMIGEDVQPKLSGGPNYLIDLEDNTTKPDEICQLVERFMHHTSKKKAHKNKVQLSIVTVSRGGEIQKEKMSVELEDTKIEPVLAETPGEKLKKLREELERQMAEQREKLWEQRMSRKSGEDGEEDMDVYEGEKEDCCDGENEMEIDDEDEKEEAGNENEDADDEEEEDEDDEEEVEENNGDVEGDENEVNEEENETDESACESDNEEEEVEKRKAELTKSAKKRLKRIIMNDDSDSEDEDEKRDRNKTASTDSLDSQFQPGQKVNDFTPEKSRRYSKPELGFLTPVCNLTGLQSLNSGSKFLQESPKRQAIPLPPDPSPLKGWQKQLFSEKESTQANSDDEEMEQTQSSQNPVEIEPDLPPTTQDLLDLCSGKFEGFTQQQATLKQTQDESNNDLLNKSNNEGNEFLSVAQNKCSDSSPSNENPSFSLNEPNKLTVESKTAETHNNSPSTVGVFQVPKVPDVTSSIVDDDDDKLISQILDEEEMEAFKQKFVSPVGKQPDKARGVGNCEISTAINFNSDEEEEDDDDMMKVKKKKKANPAALMDSDEEAIDDDTNLDEEEQDSEEEEEEEGIEAGEEREVEYDSEENEILVDANAKPKKMKIKDFFENEAELSESEWGSADEDEKDMDMMDIELGDAENIDQNKVRRDLEKIHMRQMLDEDKREVKILQELLLEDGELHGSGRQRQFRWKNIDGAKADENTAQDENDDCILEEDENELEWRRKRFEREEFLRKQNRDGQDAESGTTLDITASSGVLKLGHKFVLKNKVQVEKKVIEPPVKFAPMQVVRGSFLARTDKVLTRVAEYTKEITTTEGRGGVATSKKHFVFQTVNVEKTKEMEKKRKATEVGTPQAIKKMRIENLSPAFQKSGNNRMKKLFSNL